MKPIDSLPNCDLLGGGRNDSETFDSSGVVLLYSLDHGPWQTVLLSLQRALNAQSLVPLNGPVALILHDLLNDSVKKLHRRVFRRVVESDFGLAIQDNEQLEALFQAEMSEHGVQNIVQHCRILNQAISVSFAAEGKETPFLKIEIPFRWESSLHKTEKLIDALGFRVEAQAMDRGSWIALVKRPDRKPRLVTPAILQVAERNTSTEQIFSQLGYGLIHFSSVGEIVAVSPSMLARLGLDQTESSLNLLSQAIPLTFHNDVLWGLALADGNGAFENYRIRVKPSDHAKSSILFNVSGFRRPDGVIQSLWQAVSQDESGGQLSEGSMLTEVRIHNISRNYVPQLVAQKARDAVRLGKTVLADEERPVAVLFCDVVGFTSYVAHHSEGESVIDTLNSILRRVSQSVTRNRGSIDKFMGDCVMAIFDDPVDAALTAIDMQRHSIDINTLRSRAGQQPLELRIGIHWGDVVIGNVGTAERLDWTAIGDVVNTASRIEKGSDPGSILVSNIVREKVETSRPGEFEFGPVYELVVKGKLEALEVCKLVVK